MLEYLCCFFGGIIIGMIIHSLGSSSIVNRAMDVLERRKKSESDDWWKNGEPPPFFGD